MTSSFVITHPPPLFVQVMLTCQEGSNLCQSSRSSPEISLSYLLCILHKYNLLLLLQLHLVQSSQISFPLSQDGLSSNLNTPQGQIPLIPNLSQFLTKRNQTSAYLCLPLHFRSEKLEACIRKRACGAQFLSPKILIPVKFPFYQAASKPSKFPPFLCPVSQGGALQSPKPLLMMKTCYRETP